MIIIEETLSLKRKLNKLEMLKEQRDKENNTLRCGVKPRWNGNPTSWFASLKESLKTRSGRLKLYEYK